jgi:hypothetical protein
MSCVLTNQCGVVRGPRLLHPPRAWCYAATLLFFLYSIPCFFIYPPPNPQPPTPTPLAPGSPGSPGSPGCPWWCIPGLLVVGFQVNKIFPSAGSGRSAGSAQSGCKCANGRNCAEMAQSAEIGTLALRRRAGTKKDALAPKKTVLAPRFEPGTVLT